MGGGVGVGPGSGGLGELARELRIKLGQLQNASVEMDRLWRTAAGTREGASRKEIWKRKVEQVAEETDSLRLALDKFISRENRRIRDEQERQDLLRRVVDDKLDGSRLMSEYDEENAARSSVANSSRMIEEAFATARGVLSSYADQRDRLKARSYLIVACAQSAQRKVFDVLNTVGLSSAMLRVIERRQSMDKLLVYGGMLVTLAVVLLIWLWT
eukprot:jgi/Chlat1/6370/Chrsp44S05753